MSCFRREVWGKVRVNVLLLPFSQTPSALHISYTNLLYLGVACSEHCQYLGEIWVQKSHNLTFVLLNILIKKFIFQSTSKVEKIIKWTLIDISTCYSNTPLLWTNAWAAVTIYHRLGSSNDRNVFSYCSGGCKSQIQAPASSVSGVNSLPCLQTAAFLLSLT